MGERNFSKGDGEKTEQQCWTTMTRGEKILLVLLILSLILVLLLLTYIALIFISAEETCDSPNCVKASAKLLESLDFGRNPCTNFQQFLCSNIPNFFTSENISLKKINLISAPPESGDGGALVTVKQFYQACVNASAIEAAEDSTIATIIARMGGWPLLLESKWKDSNFSWQWYMTEVRRWGIKNDWLITLDYYEDTDGVNLLLIQPPALKTTRNKFNLVYHEEMVLQLAAKLGATVTISTTKIKELIDFENELARISDNARRQMIRSKNYSKIRVRRLNEIWPNVNLLEVLNSLARGYSVFTNSSVVVIASEGYLYQLHALLGRTNNRIQANYFVWKTIEYLLPFCSSELRDIYSKYFDLPPRENQCFDETLKRFYSTVEASSVSWYQEEQSLKALETMAKLMKPDVNVAISEEESPKCGFSDVVFKSENMLWMVNEIEFKATNDFFKCLHRRTSSCKSEGYYDSKLDNYESEIYYQPDDNTIYVPYNLVYSDFFKWDQPNYINYARAGRSIADALIEALNGDSSLFDGTGVEVAYKAYSKWTQNEGIEHKLPALNYTTNQLFWMHSSTSYCSLDHQEKEKWFNAIEELPQFTQDFICT